MIIIRKIDDFLFNLFPEVNDSTAMGNIFARSRNDVTTEMSYYEHALAVKPDDHIAMNNIGANLIQIDKVDEAQRYFE